MICPTCGFENIAGEDECGECGLALTIVDVEQTVNLTAPHIAQTPLREVEAAPTIMVGPTTTLGEVVTRLIGGNVSCVLVGTHARLLGIFSERDLLMRVGHRFNELKSSPVSEFMTSDPEFLEPDATIAWALNKMDVGGFRHIPIVEEGGPIRVVSVKDILEHLADEYCKAA